jgi:hypothetical protein
MNLYPYLTQDGRQLRQQGEEVPIRLIPTRLTTMRGSSERNTDDRLR